MRILMRLSILASLAMVAACSSTPQAGSESLSPDPDLPPELSQTWRRSFEEEVYGGSEIYRPMSWDLPVVRWRSRFTLVADGTLEMVAPGPKDRHYKVPGRWWSDRLDPEIIHLQPENRVVRSYWLLSVTKDRLELEPVPD